MRLSARALDLELAALRVYISASASACGLTLFFIESASESLRPCAFYYLRPHTFFIFKKREELAASCACGLMRVIASAMGLVRVRPRSIWVHPGAQPLVPGLQAKKRRALAPPGACPGLLNLNYHT